MAEIKDIDIEQTELIDTPMDEEGVDEIIDEETTMEDAFSDSLVDEKNKKVKKKKTEKGKFRIWNFSRRILALCLLPMVITCVVVTKISTGVMKDIIENEVENAMRVAAVSIDETYTNLYKGDYTRNADGAVMKGGKKISGDKKLVDAMADTTGYNVTMMFGNMRLLTTVKSSSGSRANGTGVSDSLYAEIEKGEPIFLKATVIS